MVEEYLRFFFYTFVHEVLIYVNFEFASVFYLNMFKTIIPCIASNYAATT